MRRHIAVVIVIHQPSSEIFNQFHNAYILSKVGKCVFYGSPMQLQQQLVDYEYITSGSPNMNPADIIITIASSVSKDDNKTGTDVTTDVTSDVEAANGLCATVKTAQSTKADCKRMTEKLEEMWLTSPFAHLGREIQDQGLCSYSANFRFYALWILLKRGCVTSLWRQKQLIFIRLTLHIVVVAVLTALYNRELGKDDGCIHDDMQLHDRNSSCSSNADSVASQNIRFQFFSLLFLMFAAMMPTVLTFSAEIKVCFCAFFDVIAWLSQIFIIFNYSSSLMNTETDGTVHLAATFQRLLWKFLSKFYFHFATFIFCIGTVNNPEWTIGTVDFSALCLGDMRTSLV